MEGRGRNGRGFLLLPNRLTNPGVKASASKAAGLGSIPAFSVWIFTGPRHTIDLKIGIPLATLPGAWRYRDALRLVGLVSVYCDWVKQEA